MAEESGEKKVEVMDESRKLDALMDMIKDASTKIDEGHKRLDARMDAYEADRRDSAKKDAEGAPRQFGESEDPAADKGRKDSRRDSDEDEDERKDRKDSRRDSDEDEDERKDRKDSRRRDSDEDEDEDERKDRKDSRRRDSDEDEDERKDRKDSRRRDEDDGAEADSAPISRAEARLLQAQILALSERAPQIISDADRSRFASIQEQADPVFQAFGDRAPAPMDGETPMQYKRRLGGKMQINSDKYKDARLSSISDETLLDTVIADVYADSLVAARRGADVPMGALRMITKQSGGHTINEFVGDTESWMNSFAGNSQRATGDFRKPH